MAKKKKNRGFNYRKFARSLRPELIEQMGQAEPDSKDTGRLPYRAAARLPRSADTEERLP